MTFWPYLARYFYILFYFIWHCQGFPQDMFERWYDDLVIMTLPLWQSSKVHAVACVGVRAEKNTPPPHIFNGADVWVKYNHAVVLYHHCLPVIWFRDRPRSAAGFIMQPNSIFVKHAIEIIQFPVLTLLLVLNVLSILYLD